MNKIIVVIIVLLCLSIGIIYALRPVEDRIYAEEHEMIFTQSSNPYQLYRCYKDIERYPTNDYAIYVFDPRDDAYLTTVVDNIIDDISPVYRNNDTERIDAIAYYVQSIVYAPEEKEYPKFPVETIIDGAGDCEDKAILGASLLDLLGYNVSLVLLTSQKHMVVGVNLGSGYEYLELTEEGWGLGEKQIEDNLVFYTIEDRPLVYHSWENITFHSSTFRSYVKGTVIIHNLGRADANVTLVVNNMEKKGLVSPFCELRVDFDMGIGAKNDFRTQLYLNAKLVEEKQVD